MQEKKQKKSNISQSQSLNNRALVKTTPLIFRKFPKSPQETAEKLRRNTKKLPGMSESNRHLFCRQIPASQRGEAVGAPSVRAHLFLNFPRFFHFMLLRNVSSFASVYDFESLVRCRETAFAVCIHDDEMRIAAHGFGQVVAVGMVGWASVMLRRVGYAVESVCLGEPQSSGVGLFCRSYVFFIFLQFFVAPSIFCTFAAWKELETVFPALQKLLNTALDCISRGRGFRSF